MMNEAPPKRRLKVAVICENPSDWIPPIPYFRVCVIDEITAGTLAVVHTFPRIAEHELPDKISIAWKWISNHAYGRNADDTVINSGKL